MTQQGNFSQLDRIINIHQSIKLTQVTELNKAMLLAQRSQNEKLTALNRQIAEANAINRKILENQISQIEREEILRFHKSFVFHTSELIEIIESVEDKYIKSYFIYNLRDKILHNLEIAKESLDEISDKNQAKIQIERFKIIAEGYLDFYKNSPFEKLNQLVDNYESIERENKQKLLEMKQQIKKVKIPNRFFGLNQSAYEKAKKLIGALEQEHETRSREIQTLKNTHPLRSYLEDISNKYDEFDDLTVRVSEFELQFNHKYATENKTAFSKYDKLFREAARLIVANQMGSSSLIQRRMKLGYNRANKLMEQLETAGIVGPNLGSKAREVLIKTDSDLELLLQNL